MSRLLNQIKQEIRRRNYSYRTEKSYCRWITQFVLCHNLNHALLNIPSTKYIDIRSLNPQNFTLLRATVPIPQSYFPSVFPIAGTRHLRFTPNKNLKQLLDESKPSV
jgi:hypothetical protein